jgi:hypothetical protein
LALQSNPPPAANYRFIHKQPVYVNREKDRHWTGPQLVALLDAKQYRTSQFQYGTSETSKITLDIGAVVLLTPQPPSVGESTHQVHLFTLSSHLNAPRLIFTAATSPRDHLSGLIYDVNERRLTAFSSVGRSS